MEIIFNNFKYDLENPSTCPHCHRGIEPIFFFHVVSKGQNDAFLCYSIWKCTYRECGRHFVAVYDLYGQGRWDLQGFLDGSPIGPHWPESIVKLESKFIKTYMQALQAEYLGLDEISGMGYRKSIEYLVKDYLTHKNESLMSQIEDIALSKAISDNFKEAQDSDLKQLLQRATWLGNDMTHYLKYHDTFDINDLKELIKLVMDEIHSIEQKRHYIQTIQSKYKK